MTTFITSRHELQQVTVDWSHLFPLMAEAASNSEINQLLEWVRTYPRKNAIHVYLKTSCVHHDSRRVQSTLQALGCKVTTCLSARE